MDCMLYANESSVALWSEIKRALPEIAKEFGIQIDQLHIMDYRYYPGAYMDTEYRDIPYKLGGFVKGLPFMQHHGIHFQGKLGYGISYFKSREDSSLRYAVYVQKGEWNDIIYVIAPRNKMFRLVRIAEALTRKANVIKDIPILPEEILTSVVNNSIGFLKSAKAIENYGVKIKRGILLDGPPGNGKTMLCRYIQKLCTKRGYRWGVVTSADIDKAYSEKSLTQLFQMFTITFFDDIDVSYLNRKEGAGKMACSLLTAMDGMYEGGHLVRIFTTNEQIDALDDAFTRPGRIDHIITLDKPTEDLRKRLISEVWPKEIIDNIDVEKLVECTEDFSFAEVEAIRTYLVTWKVVCGGGWDLDRALDEFADRKKETRRKVGFEPNKKKKKSNNDCFHNEGPTVGFQGKEKDNSWSNHE